MTDSKFAVVMLLGGLSCGHQSEPTRPAETQIEGNKMIATRDVRIPATAVADKENAVAGIGDDRAAIANGELQVRSSARGLTQSQNNGVVATAGNFLAAQIGVLEITKRRTVFCGDAFDGEKP